MSVLTTPAHRLVDKRGEPCTLVVIPEAGKRTPKAETRWGQGFAVVDYAVGKNIEVPLAELYIQAVAR